MINCTFKKKNEVFFQKELQGRPSSFECLKYYILATFSQ